MKLHYGICSGNSARACFGLLEAGVSFEPVLVDTRAQENLSAGYLALNPMGKIPALSDGDFQLWESNAINIYAAEKQPGRKLIPATPRGRASMQRWLFFQSAHVSPACLPVFRAANPRVLKFWRIANPDHAAAERGRKELARFLPVLEAALEGRDWLEGDVSLADIAYAPHLVLIEEAGFDYSPYPRVRAWLARLTARPAWREVAARIFAPIDSIPS